MCSTAMIMGQAASPEAAIKLDIRRNCANNYSALSVLPTTFWGPRYAVYLHISQLGS